jgi:hypothetical protein
MEHRSCSIVNGSEIMEVTVGWTCSWGTYIFKIFVGNLLESDHLKDLGDGRITLIY